MHDFSYVTYLSIAVMVIYHVLFLRTIFDGDRNFFLNVYTALVYVAYYKVFDGQSVFFVTLTLHTLFFIPGVLLSRRRALLVFFPFNILPAYLAAPDTSYGISHSFADALEVTGLAYACCLLLYACIAVVRRFAYGPEKPDAEWDALADYDLTWMAKRRMRMAIFESDYGREQGWYVLVDNKPVALLTDCMFAEMFWDSYKVEPVNGDGRVFSPEFWQEQSLVFINVRFGIAAKYAFAAGSAMRSDEYEKDRIRMRGLYIVIPPPSFAEMVILFCRSKWKRFRPAAHVTSTR